MFLWDTINYNGLIAVEDEVIPMGVQGYSRRMISFHSSIWGVDVSTVTVERDDAVTITEGTHMITRSGIVILQEFTVGQNPYCLHEYDGELQSASDHTKAKACKIVLDGGECSRFEDEFVHRKNSQSQLPRPPEA